MTGDSRPWAVILTGGATPDEATDAARRYEIGLALRNAGLDGAGYPCVLSEADVLAAVRAGFRAGYERAAKAHRVVAVWVVDGEERAAGFAQWVTREIDPAYIRQVSDPLAEMLRAAARPEDMS